MHSPQHEMAIAMIAIPLNSTTVLHDAYGWHGTAAAGGGGRSSGGAEEGVGFGERWHAAWSGSGLEVSVKVDVYGTVFASAVSTGPVVADKSGGAPGAGVSSGSKRTPIPAALSTPTLTKIVPMPLPPATTTAASTTDSSSSSGLPPVPPTALGADGNDPPHYGGYTASGAAAHQYSLSPPSGGGGLLAVEGGAFALRGPPTFLVCWHWQLPGHQVLGNVPSHVCCVGV